MTNVNLGAVVEVLDPLVSPTVYQLRRSAYFVVLPSVQFRSVFAAFQCSSSCIYGFVMIHLPLVVFALSFLLTRLLWNGSEEFSMPQKLL